MPITTGRGAVISAGALATNRYVMSGVTAAVRHVGKPLERSRFILHLDIDDVSELDVGALARVVRATKHGVSDEPVLAHAEFSEARADGGFENALGVIEREFDFA